VAFLLLLKEHLLLLLLEEPYPGGRSGGLLYAVDETLSGELLLSLIVNR